MNRHPKKIASLGTIFRYALGEGGFSICINGMSNFGMIYLTQILGLNPAWAAVSISIATLWDAITDPLMGHISDNTRARRGRRHPYMLVGGVLSAACFLAFWTVPQFFDGPVLMFILAMILNLMIRTAATIFYVPYTALGFEICPEYDSRAKLQGVRFFINQITNFTFGALAWSMFFRDVFSEDGVRTDGSLIASNYLLMSIVLSAFVAGMILASVFGTWSYAVDNRGDKVRSNNLSAFWNDFISIFKDRLAIQVFAFFIIAQFAMILMATIQMFTYIFFMEFSQWEKTFVHGGGMLAFAFASLSLSRVVSRFDKKQAGYIGIGFAIFGGIGLTIVFIGGLMQPGQQLGIFGSSIPVATIVFGVLQWCWWGGCGMVVPLASSMVADIAALSGARTGEVRNAAYASVFSFSSKAAASLGILICGFMVQMAGIVSGADSQSPQAVQNIAVMSFFAGPVVILVAGLVLARYPVTRTMMKASENQPGDI